MKKNTTDNYQHGFSKLQPSMYQVSDREKKASKTIAVIRDHISDLSNLNLLDIGCSTGIMTNFYSNFFKSITALDIDKDAVNYAKSRKKNKNIHFLITSIEESNLSPNSYDVITCSHIYEHVPDSEVLMKAIFKYLKPGGICYFAAGNRYQIFENHYKLYFLSYFPKKISNFYLRITKKGDYYYENHLSLLKLKKLTKDFTIHDYTLKIIKNPLKFKADEMINPNKVYFPIVKLLSNIFYFFIPTYIWLLEKPNNTNKIN
jgi:2-polyprenyl-3-methyl-5-hydroxy-6-metoxy-1,4-benzoquinol methylase